MLSGKSGGPTAPSDGPISPSPVSGSTPAQGGEGVELGPADAATHALSAALDEPLLLDAETGAGDLLSTAFTSGIPNPYSSAQGGWVVGPQDVDPYSNVNAATGALSFFVGQDVDPYSAEAAAARNPNAFTGTQDVEPFSGFAMPGFYPPGSDAVQSAMLAFAIDADTGRASSPVSAKAVTPSVNESPANPGGAATVGGSSASGWYLSANTLFTFSTDGDGNPVVNEFVGPLPLDIQQQIDAASTASTATIPSSAPAAKTSSTATPNPQIQQVTTNQDMLLKAIQDAVGSPTPLTPAQPGNISDVLSGSDWAALLNPLDSSLAPVSNSQTSLIAQVLSGTYEESVLQAQLSSQGSAPGSFASPSAPYDYLFNPNATSLTEAMLLASRSPNAQLLQADEIQLWVSMLPIIGPVSTWMNPRSGSFAKGVAAVGLAASVLPLGSELSRLGAGLGPELETLGPELPALGREIGNAGPGFAEGPVPTGPSFEGVIDPSEFENHRVIIDRLSRARQFDIGGYRSLTARGAFGRGGDSLASDEALQNAYIRLMKDVERVSDVTRDNPAIALDHELHWQIRNLTTSQMQGLTPNDVLQYHLQQMSGFAPDYVLQILEREVLKYIYLTF
jgi:hypothetical protein